MAIERPKRVFLDSCILIDLAKGKWPDDLRGLCDAIDKGECRVIVTSDHLSDYEDCSDTERAISEGEHVDRLRPLWMLSGGDIHRWEAYSDYLRLEDKPTLLLPSPSQDVSELLRPLIENCTCSEEFKKYAESLAAFDCGITFSDRLKGTFGADKMGMGPGMVRRLRLKDDYACSRDRARRQGESDEDWDRYLRTRWVTGVTKLSAVIPEAYLKRLAEKVDFERMPAWAAHRAVERVWRNDQARAKRSDLNDMRHLAQLPYVDVFITEKYLAEMIKQAKVAGKAFVGTNIGEWLADVGKPRNNTN